ncbi:SDR family oxidoreductase [Paenibacillus sp. GP183]|jgi:NAD(P)-dependent dehydrogenase (short-subunit alcohol dehydrogenase family)|uniref:SDR family oxidoreductase n=1 Tax=Paenibacillus sp. GP183 TaxID=1882751 RepID=UPI0008994D5A|nr:SDR family oxidoreductase [Paenibacillus sp. GP183]SEB49995.1 NAD(P)-dependent dehydrogenase, short-chain alcohol dehydrogenase family [Paenibacillus sp. GP183]
MSMQGQRVVVVGGTSGIGLAAAKAFIAESANVVIASRSASKLAEAKQSLGGRVEGYELDFRDTAKSAELFGQIGTFDHLVVTAGEGAMGPFSELPLDKAKAAFESKFWGQYVVVKSALPYLHKSGSITLTSGVYGRRPSKGASTLAAINSAIEGLVRGLAVDLAPIRINVVSPGIVETPAYAGIPEQNRKAMFERMGAQLPVGRIAQAEDIGETYVYLAKNGFTTGTTVIIDGGAHLV